VPMLLLALWATRNIAVAPLVGLPVVARAFAAKRRVGVRYSRAFVAAACTVIVLIGAVTFSSGSAQGDYEFASYPVKAMHYLDRHGLLGRRLLTDDADAGYVINQYWPRQHVFMDDRFDMYPMPLMWDFLAVAAGDAKWQRILDHYDVDTVVWRSNEPLAQLLRQSSEWRRVYHDRTFSVFLRN